VDLFVTDPPYVIGAVSAGTLGSKAGSWADMMNSAHWFAAWYAEAWRILRDTGALWTFCNWRSLPVIMRAAAQSGMPVTSVLVWDKQWIGPGGTQGLRPRYELVALMAKPAFGIPDRGLPDIWSHLWSSIKPSGHPAEKPVSLLRRLITASGIAPGGIVCDPFLGSGSTGVAAVIEGCAFIGIEQEQAWYDVAATRIAAAQAQPRLLPVEAETWDQLPLMEAEA
jgi:DNA modification methylase